MAEFPMLVPCVMGLTHQHSADQNCVMAYFYPMFIAQA